MDGLFSAGAGIGAACTGGVRAGGAGTGGSAGDACGVDPFAFGNEWTAPFAAGLGATGFDLGVSSTTTGAGDVSGTSATTGSCEDDVASSTAAAGTGRTAGCASPPAAFCALAAARAAFSSWRFCTRASAFCFLIALFEGFRADSDALWRAASA